jgi:hypothetical protein
MDSVIEFAEGYGYTREEIEAMIPEIDVGAYAVTTLSYLANILTQVHSLVLGHIFSGPFNFSFPPMVVLDGARAADRDLHAPWL